ncbi:Pyruvate kinase [Brettanomyces bruxellensis]|uniref:Pyruvate kinase n=1 Tax=Dekkera bruxellensis TaxID=5007 RepID=A0A7D9CYC0_DEKBR|nr:Pyruvate kinase [Brettanomyces bruxellensis]KAF6012467.1 Pyruvate kinase [Brettanomyces bruxellensis]KAF6015602.1 Pyruvate kinase [Brettanomyces bruxellensis]QOU19762.1 Pyruvate kinase [Brettanomyces bruxellensis]VUG18611.1 CDC19 [Brettanomyces bruxellensis]
MSTSSKLNWLVNLDVQEPRGKKNFRRSSIICTIGPKTSTVENLVKLRKAGMNIARMNFSHGSYEFHQGVINNCRKSEEIYAGRPLALALDTKGPEIRTGLTIGGKDYPYKAGETLTFTTDDKYAEKCDSKLVYVDYKNLTKVIKVGKIIFVDDGIQSFEVEEIVDDKTLKVKSLNSGNVSSKKGVNLPNTPVDLPALSEKDEADLRFGVKNHVDMVFASFIRTADDVRHIRRVLGEEGKDIKIICKIESQQGVDNFDDILKVTDGIMVARGDLGIEIPAPEVFAVQKQLIAKCNLVGKPVACATQMLESMTYNPRPTRAEVSDVGNAILDGADCVMLSGETAKGNYPCEAVTMMSQTALLAEHCFPYVSHFNEIRELTAKPVDTTETIALSAVAAVVEQSVKAVVVLSTTGATARLTSKYRPNCPILCVTRNQHTARVCHLYRGVYPFVYTAERAADWNEDIEARIQFAIKNGVEMGLLNKGDQIAVVQGHAKGLGHSNTMRILSA